MRFTPPAMAMPHSPRRMLSQARWTASSDDEHAGDRIVRVPARVSGQLDQLPRGLEEQALLRVHVVGVLGEDAEDAGVELVDAAQERAPAAVRGARPAAVLAEVGTPVPALLRNL